MLSFPLTLPIYELLLAPVFQAVVAQPAGSGQYLFLFESYNKSTKNFTTDQFNMLYPLCKIKTLTYILQKNKPLFKPPEAIFFLLNSSPFTGFQYPANFWKNRFVTWTFNFKKRNTNRSISPKVFIFAAGITPYTIIKKTFR